MVSRWVRREREYMEFVEGFEIARQEARLATAVVMRHRRRLEGVDVLTARRTGSGSPN